MGVLGAAGSVSPSVPWSIVDACSKNVLLLPALPQTRITLNGGADWRALDPPASYRWPVCNTCKPGAPADQCRLHLHGPTSWFAPQGKRGAALVFWLAGLMTGTGMLLAFQPGLTPAEAAGPHPNFCSHQGRGSFFVRIFLVSALASSSPPCRCRRPAPRLLQP